MKSMTLELNNYELSDLYSILKAYSRFKSRNAYSTEPGNIRKLTVMLDEWRGVMADSYRSNNNHFLVFDGDDIVQLKDIVSVYVYHIGDHRIAKEILRYINDYEKDHS